MPLIKSASKKAFQKNLETEMSAGKPKDQSLAISYSVMKKNKPKKKMAKGGEAKQNYHQGAQEARKYSAQKQEQGVHSPRMPYPHSKESFGESQAGYQSRGHSEPPSADKDRHTALANKERKKQGMSPLMSHKEAALKEHSRVMEESKNIKPKLQGLAEGGQINAKNARRPMPDNHYDDSEMISKNSGNKPSKNDSWTDNSTIAQAQAKDSRAVMPIKHPKMVPQNAYSVRLRDEEDSLQSSASPGPYGAQPPKHDDEQDASASGNSVSDMEAEHSNHKPPYNKAIEDQYSQDMAAAEMKRSSSYANGGPVMEPEDDTIEHQEREYERQLQLRGAPSEDEGDADAHSRNEEGPNRQGPTVSDMEDEHSTGRKPYAGGGRIGDDEDNMDHDMELNPAHDKHSPDDSEDQPEHEEEMEHAASIAAAIMAKRQRYAAGGSVESGARDMNYADGGKIKSHGSMDTHEDDDQADLSRNADEDANEEDQASFNALRKENYSESEGLKQLDQPHDSNLHGDSEEDDSENLQDKDIVSAIRRKMKIRSAITR